MLCPPSGAQTILSCVTVARNHSKSDPNGSKVHTKSKCRSHYRTPHNVIDLKFDKYKFETRYWVRFFDTCQYE